MVNIWVHFAKMRPGSLVVNTFVKDNETEETLAFNRLFCYIFFIGVISIGEGPGPLDSPLAIRLWLTTICPIRPARFEDLN